MLPACAPVHTPWSFVLNWQQRRVGRLARLINLPSFDMKGILLVKLFSGSNNIYRDLMLLFTSHYTCNSPF